MATSRTQKALNKWTRKLHRWGAIAIAVPAAIVIVSGVLLQLKKQWTWVQPPTQRGAEPALTISFDDIMASVASRPEAGIASWDDVDRLDVRPSRGVVKVRGKNRWEVQVDTSTGAVLQSTHRRSDLIESIHDGSWFHDTAKLWIFLPNGLVLLLLWLTGVYLWALPIVKRRRGRIRRAALAAHRRLSAIARRDARAEGADPPIR